MKTKTRLINFRVTEEQAQMLKSAASMFHQPVSSFLLESAAFHMSEKARRGETGDPLTAAFRELERSHDVERLSPQRRKKMEDFDSRRLAGSLRTQSVDSALGDLINFKNELAAPGRSLAKPVKLKPILRMKKSS
jgi:hypothetical protein